MLRVVRPVVLTVSESLQLQRPRVLLPELAARDQRRPQNRLFGPAFSPPATTLLGLVTQRSVGRRSVSSLDATTTAAEHLPLHPAARKNPIRRVRPQRCQQSVPKITEQWGNSAPGSGSSLAMQVPNPSR